MYLIAPAEALDLNSIYCAPVELNGMFHYGKTVISDTYGTRLLIGIA